MLFLIFLLFLSCNIQVICLIFCKCHKLLIVYIAKGGGIPSELHIKLKL